MAGRVVLITGCSSGFGLLLAARLAAHGEVVYATMRDTRKQERLLKEVARQGGSVQVLPLDVTDDQSIAPTVAAVERERGRLDVLVNNAGYGLGGALEDLLESEVRAQMETNFFGVLKVTNQCLPLLRRSKKAHIINVSSIAGLCGIPGIGAYSASKFALEGYTEALWYELGLFGIAVTLIEPGTYRTEVQDNRKLAARIAHPDSHYRDYSKSLLDATDRRVSQAKGEPEDVARLIEQVIDAKKPALRYAVGREARAIALLRRILPFRRLSRILTRALLR